MLILLICGLLSSVCNLAWYGTDETDQLKWLTTIMSAGVNFGTIVSATGSFFTQGLPALITWDYAYLSGAPWKELIRFIAFCLTAIGFVWTIILLIYPILGAALGAIGGGVLGLGRRIFGG